MACAWSRTKLPSAPEPLFTTIHTATHKEFYELGPNQGQLEASGRQGTNDDLDVVAGRRDQLAGKIQERYGIAKDEAEKQLADWERKASDSWFK